MGRYIIGADEVGRGCVAGDVYVAAVMAAEDAPRVEGVRDSKKLSASAREKVYGRLCGSQHVYATTASRPASVVDEKGITVALRECFVEAILKLSQLGKDVAEVRVDGNPFALPVPYPVKFIVKGDDSEYTIGAASIFAKVTRDAYMDEMDAQHPGYGFAKHKGYGTPAHVEAIQRLGLSPIHRATFCRAWVPGGEPKPAVFEDPNILDLFG